MEEIIIIGAGAAGYCIDYKTLRCSTTGLYRGRKDKKRRIAPEEAYGSANEGLAKSG